MFLSTGGYHHHIAANQWQSSGAPPMDPVETGLAYVELASRDPGRIGIFTDPWGIEVRATAV